MPDLRINFGDMRKEDLWVFPKTENSNMIGTFTDRTVEIPAKWGEFKQAMQAAAAEMPVINNVDVAVETDPAQIRDALIRQLYSPVRWVETVLALKEQGVIRVYECGPGKVLGGLIKRIDRDVASCALETADAFEAALTGQ